MKELDLDEKARMLFALSAPIDPDFLKKLQWESYVEVDHLNRIVKYQSEKGLKLCGIHFFQDEAFKAAVDKKKKKKIKKKKPTKRQRYDSEDDWDDDDWGTSMRKKQPKPQPLWGIRRIPQKKVKTSEVVVASEAPVETRKPPPRPSEWQPFPETPEQMAARLLAMERYRLANLSKSSEIQQIDPVENGNFNTETQKISRFDNSYLERMERNAIFDSKTPRIHQKPPRKVHFSPILPDFPEISDELEDSNVSNKPKLTAITDLGEEPESRNSKIVPNSIWKLNKFNELYCTLPIDQRKPIHRYVDVETEGFGSSLKILRAIEDLLDMVYTDEFAGMKQKIEKAKVRFQRQDKSIALDTISISLRSALLVIKNSAKAVEKSVEKSSEDSNDLFGILVMLWGISLSLQPIKLEDFQKDVTDSMLALAKSKEEKTVPIQALHTVLDLLLLTIIV